MTSRWVVVVATVIACVAFGFALHETSGPPLQGCRGVGATGPSASTPEAALAAYLPDGLDVADWQRLGDAGSDEESYAFAPKQRHTTLTAGADLEVQSITVSKHVGSWRVDGLCV